MINRKKVLRQLELIDWDFPAQLNGTTQSLHWYPGTFPAQLPATLIQGLSIPEARILDTYGGIGTTSAEALRLGRRAWHIDLNPIANLAAYVHGCLLLLLSDKPEYFVTLFDRIEHFVSPRSGLVKTQLRLTVVEKFAVDEFLAKVTRPTPKGYADSVLGPDPPNSEMLSKWIEPNTLDHVEHLLRQIVDSEMSSFERLFLLSALSSVIKSLSSQTRSWGHIADNVLPREMVNKDPRAYLARYVRRARNVLSSVVLQRTRLNKSRGIRYWVSDHDWTHEKQIVPAPKGKIDVLITSPPYGGAIDYTLSQRLSLYLMGYSDDAISSNCQSEIGARRKRFQSSARSDWASQLAEVLEMQLRTMSDAGYVAYVMPHKEAGRETGSEQLRSALADLGWLPMFMVDRSIRQLRARQSWTSIKKETVEIFSRV